MLHIVVVEDNWIESKVITQELAKAFEGKSLDYTAKFFTNREEVLSSFGDILKAHLFLVDAQHFDRAGGVLENDAGIQLLKILDENQFTSPVIFHSKGGLGQAQASKMQVGGKNVITMHKSSV